MVARNQLVGSRSSIDIRDFVRAGLCAPGDSLKMKWHSSHTGAQHGSATVTMLDIERLHIVHFESDMPAEILDLTYTATAFGGQRAWFLCSKLGCGKRVAVLHATPKGFRCRHCTHLVYSSQFEQPNDRVLRRARMIRERLGGSRNLFDPFPSRPRGMHSIIYDKLLKQEMQFWERYVSKLGKNDKNS
jgi:hypothetical protein